MSICPSEYLKKSVKKKVNNMYIDTNQYPFMYFLQPDGNQSRE